MEVEQCERHFLRLPDTFEGIAIDRLDYSEAFNYDRDDGVSWVPGQAVGSCLKSTRLCRRSKSLIGSCGLLWIPAVDVNR